MKICNLLFTLVITNLIISVMNKLLKTNSIKFFCHKIFFIFLLLSSSIQIFAQAPGVEIQRSNEKALINGKVYYIHTVKKG
jgi:hypothetical protein